MVGRRDWIACAALGILALPRVARAHVPGLRSVDLGGLPTRVTSHPDLAARLGFGSLHVKRDDEAGDGFGGSKARKLEPLLADARDRGHRSVLTFGGAGSNHALATAIHARRLGMEAHLVLLPEPAGAHVRWHLLAAAHAGARLHAGTRAHRDDPARAVADFAAGEDPYVIPAGGTCPLGTAGYVGAGLELAAQIERGELPRPDVVYVAAGTTGTASGLWIGLRAAGLGCRLVAVRASGRATATRARVEAEVRSTQALLRSVDARFPATPLDGGFVLEHGFAGAGYARPTPAGRAAAAMVGEAFALDGTYTQKAFAALAAGGRDLRGREGEAALFWHTYDPRQPPTGTTTVEDLPRALRGYARE